MASGSAVGSDALYDCDPCKSSSKVEKVAVEYCPDCKEYFCEDCKISHEKLGLTRQHKARALSPHRSSVKVSPRASSSKIKGALTGIVGKLSPKPTNSPPVLSMQFDVSLDTDTKPCLVTDILLTGKVTIVLDPANNAMKIFDRQNYFCKYSAKVENPLKVAQVKHDEIAVTNGNRNSVHLFTFSEKSAAMQKKFNTELPCYEAYYSKEHNLLYVVCREDGIRSLVAVHTLDGKLTRRIEPLLPGSEVLKGLNGIAIQPMDKRIYVTDYKKGLIILSSSGQFESVVHPKELKNARSPAIDRAGRVYFLGLNSHNLFVLPPVGRDATVLISEGIPDPECIAIDGKQLVVGCRRTNLVKIFTFN